MLKAIPLRQPYAELIALGEKLVETRDRRIQHRGDVAIYACKTFNQDDEANLRRITRAYPALQPLLQDFVRGSVICVARLVDVVSMTEEWIQEQTAKERVFGFYEPGRYGWLLSDVRLLPMPVPCNSEALPGPWWLSASVESRIRDLL